MTDAERIAELEAQVAALTVSLTEATTALEAKPDELAQFVARSKRAHMTTLLRESKGRQELIAAEQRTRAERNELAYDHEPERLTPEETQETAVRLGREPQPVRGSRLT